MKMRLIFLTILSLTIIQCGGTQELTQRQSENTGDDKKNDISLSYSGSVKEVRLYDGGWYGLFPNYNIDFTMQVDAQGLIQAKVDTPECQSAGSIPVADFEALLAQLTAAETVPAPPNVAVPVDVGQKLVSLKETTSRGLLEEGITHFRHQYPQYTQASGETLYASIRQMADQLIEREGCNNLEISRMSFVQRIYDSKLGPQIQDPSDMVANIVREFEIKRVNNQYMVSGSEVKTQPYGGCNRLLKDVILPMDIVDPMHAIDFQLNTNICLAQPIGNTGLFVTVERGDNLIQRGQAGCWNRVQLRNHEIFVERFIKFIETHVESCWAQ